MLSKFLDPKNDIAFKKIFGSEKNKDILIHFLNDMLTFKKKAPIRDVTFLKTSQDPETAAKKTSIVDILCKDESGNTYIVEMQVAHEKGFIKRAQYYASKAYVSQANASEKFHDLQEVIFLAISNFTMFPDKKAYKSDHVVLDKDTQENDLKDFSFTFLELPKFNKGIDQLTNMIDKWAYFFKHAADTTEEELEKLVNSDKIIKKAYKQLDKFYWSDEDLLTYEQSEKYEKTYIASLDYKFDEGMKVGEEKGRREGEKVGKEEGMKVAKMEMAKTLLQQGVDIQIIKTATGLSEAEISKARV